MGNHVSRIDSISGPGGNISVPVGAGTTTNLEGFIGMLAGSYSVLQQPGARADLLAGVRCASLKSSLHCELAGPAGVIGTSGSVDARTSLTDGIVGARGAVDLAGRWFVPWDVDAGTSSSRFTWQAMVGVGHHFDWADATLAYRHLGYDFHTNRVAPDIAFSGPAFAFSFKC